MESPVKSPEWAELDRINEAMDAAVDANDTKAYMKLDAEWQKQPVEVRRAWIRAHVAVYFGGKA